MANPPGLGHFFFFTRTPRSLVLQAYSTHPSHPVNKISLSCYPTHPEKKLLYGCENGGNATAD